MRRTLAEQGIRKFTVLLSHWHLDHVAGNGVFADCEILASLRTHELLSRHREAIEAGSLEGPPPIKPLVMPTRLLPERTSLTVGSIEVDLIPVEIHSEDATVVWLPEQRLLFAGDTVEDTISYVMEPERLDTHLVELERLGELGASCILPNHGSAERIAGGGYSDGLIRATQDYIQSLLLIRRDPTTSNATLRELIAHSLDAGWVSYFPPYEQVHRENVRSVVDARP